MSMNEVDAALISNPFYYSREKLRRIKGIIEPSTRIKHAKLIGRIGSLLGLPYYTICTGLYLFHRLSASNPSVLDRYAQRIELVSIGCLSLAMKMEETVRRLQDIYQTTMGILNGSPGDTGATLGSGELDAKDMKEVKDIVMDIERLLLEDVQFEVEVHSPHRFCLSFLKLLKLKGDGSATWLDGFARDCWNMINSSYLCVVSILYPPHVIAIACILCCLKLAQLEVPPNLMVQEFYTTISCELADAVGAGKEMMDLAILLAIRDEDKITFGRVSRDLDSIQDDDEARKKLLERKPDAPQLPKYDTPRPAPSSSARFRDFDRQRQMRDARDHRDGSLKDIARGVRNARPSTAGSGISTSHRGDQHSNQMHSGSRYSYDERHQQRGDRDVHNRGADWFERDRGRGRDRDFSGRGGGSGGRERDRSRERDGNWDNRGNRAGPRGSQSNRFR